MWVLSCKLRVHRQSTKTEFSYFPRRIDRPHLALTTPILAFWSAAHEHRYAQDSPSIWTSICFRRTIMSHRPATSTSHDSIFVAITTPVSPRPSHLASPVIASHDDATVSAGAAQRTTGDPAARGAAPVSQRQDDADSSRQKLGDFLQAFRKDARRDKDEQDGRTDTLRGEQCEWRDATEAWMQAAARRDSQRCARFGARQFNSTTDSAIERIRRAAR